MRLEVVNPDHLRAARRQGEHVVKKWDFDPAAVRAVVAADDQAARDASIWMYEGSMGGNGRRVDWIGPVPQIP